MCTLLPSTLSRLSSLFTLVSALLFFSAADFSAMAADKDTPTEIKGAKVVDVGEVKASIDKKDAIIVDTRSAMNYGKGHLPTAMILPVKLEGEGDAEKASLDWSKLPDKNANIVFYGHGQTGWKAYRAAIAAVDLGYKNVMWFRVGLEAWEKAGHPVAK